MKTHVSAMLTALLLGAAVLACGQNPEEATGAAPSVANLTSNGVNATMTVDSWGGGYCTSIMLANGGSSAVTSWTLVVALNGTTLNNIWGGTSTVSGAQMTILPVDYDANIAPGASVSLGFCGTGSGQPTLASFVAVGGGGPTTFTLTVSRGGQGSGTVTSSSGGINCGSTCSAAFSSGAVVTLTAAPDSGSTFAGWSSTCPGFASGALTVSASCTVTATFNLTTGPGTAVSVNAGGSASGTFVADAYFSGGSTYSTTHRHRHHPDLRHGAAAGGPPDRAVR